MHAVHKNPESMLCGMHSHLVRLARVMVHCPRSTEDGVHTVAAADTDQVRVVSRQAAAVS